MEIENEMFLKEYPSFESVLYWKDKKDRSHEICEMIQRFKAIYDDDVENFYEVNYEFCMRSINLVSYYKDPRAFEDVFSLYINLSLDEDEVLTGVCEHYLNDFVSKENQNFLKNQWEKLFEECGLDEFVVIETLSLLLQTGFYSDEVDKIVAETLWSDNSLAKSILSANVDNLPRAKNELKRRLRYIAPMVKYGEENRGRNVYLDEWYELSESFLKHCKGIDIEEYYAFTKIERSEDDEFLIKCLGTWNERGKRINDKYLNARNEEEYLMASLKAVEVREEHMHDEFISSLPDTYNEWLNSPFLDLKQKREVKAYMHEVALAREFDLKSRKIGRNEPCPCGSGKKYKKCCLN